jgi:hypothetical protein
MGDARFLLDLPLSLGDAENRVQGWTAVTKELHLSLQALC